jgi:hypothetical protein
MQNVYSLQIIVSVVQRIEQGFPKGKTAFLLHFADVISSEQMTAFRRVEYLLRSSHVIRDLPIFTHSGDTKKSMPFSLARSL